MNTSKKFYAGIGSRDLPQGIAQQMTLIATYLEEKGYTLRSGNAGGADQAFALGVESAAQIWLPWASFERQFQLLKPEHDYKIPDELDTEADESVNRFHPVGPKLGTASRKFMARNYRQVIGKDEPNSEFVICWTPDGKHAGGTAQAMRIADHFKIQTLNMWDFTTADSIKKYLEIWHGI